MKNFKRRAPMFGMIGGIAVVSSGCSLGDIGTIVSILQALGIL